MSGSAGQLRVPVGYLRESDFPLAPLAEQWRIVARIDELFAEIAEGEAALREARKGLDLFRRALLKSAVTGELTKDWRATNCLRETAHDLLARIDAERAASPRWNNRGHRSSKARPLDQSNMPNLPNGWVWAALGKLSVLITDGDHNPPKRVAHGIPHLTAKNIKNGGIVFEGCSFVSEDGYAQTSARYTPQLGDVFITCVGTIGEVAIFREKSRVSVDRNIAGVRLTSLVSAEFVEFSLNSPSLARMMRSASGYDSTAASVFERYSFPADPTPTSRRSRRNRPPPLLRSFCFG